jgi:hypothetical protein
MILRLNTTRSSGNNYFAYFPYVSPLFEALATNLMQLNLTEPTLASFYSI